MKLQSNILQHMQKHYKPQPIHLRILFLYGLFKYPFNISQYMMLNNRVND